MAGVNSLGPHAPSSPSATVDAPPVTETMDRCAGADRAAPTGGGGGGGSGGAVPAAWLELVAPMKPRPKQLEALAAHASGSDVVLVDRTGGGKSLVFQLPAVGRWREDVRAGVAMPRLALLVVPFIALGEHQATTMNALLRRLWAAGKLPRKGRALFVRRGGGGAGDAAMQLEPTRTDASEGAAAAASAAAVKSPLSPTAGEGAELRWPTALPCGVCDGCREALPPNQLGRLELIGGRRCCWCCKVAAPAARDDWCDWCQGPQATGRRSWGCKRRDRLRRGLDCTRSADTPETTELGKRTRRSSLGGTPAAATPSAAEAEAEHKAEPTCLADLPKSAPERRIAEGADLVLACVTAASLAADSPRGRLLRDVLVARPLSLVAVDECHAVDELGMASYAPSLAQVGIMCERRDVLADGPRPPRIAATGTLPPVAAGRVLHRLRLRDDARLVRGSIDRPDVTYFRVPLERGNGESLVALGVRTLAIVRRAAPAWASEGRTMVFCTYTSTAHNLAAALRAAGKSAWAYCSRTMELDERDHNHRAWQAAPCGVICCTGSLGTGTSTANVRLVVCFNFDADPTELLQHLGRPAREDGERGVVAMCMTGQFAVERLALFAPDQREHVACFVRLLKVYFSAGCVRAALLREFGDAPLACAGCDRCCARGTCADPACGALLPVLSVPADGREAACVLLDGLRARSEPLSLSDLLAAPPADAPAAFRAPGAHHMLVLALLAADALLVDLKPHPHRRGSLVFVQPRGGALHAMRFTAAPLHVLLPASVALPEPLGPRSDGARRTALRDAAVAQQIATHLATARDMIQLAEDIFSRHVADEGRPLSALPLVARDLALLRAVRHEGVARACATTQTETPLADAPPHSPSADVAPLATPTADRASAVDDMESTSIPAFSLAAAEGEDEAPAGVVRAKATSKRTPTQIARTPGSQQRPGSVRRVTVGGGLAGGTLVATGLREPSMGSRGPEAKRRGLLPNVL